MENKKFIHALLIVALCYAQLVANVHFAGHFHSHECETPIGAVSDDCIKTQHEQKLSESILTAYLQQYNSTHEVGNSHTDTDCAIYHVLLGLSVILNADSPEFSVSLLRSDKLALTSNHHVSGASSTDRRIRAPPLVS